MATKKKNTTFLPDARFSLADTAVLMFRTSFVNYEFVMHLNESFGLKLARVRVECYNPDNWGVQTEDLCLVDGIHPLYSYYQESSRMAFVLIDKPLMQKGYNYFNFYDKMLLIKGRDAWKMMETIYAASVANAVEPEPQNLLDYRRWVLCNQMSTGIFSTDTFDFRKSTVPATSLFDGDAAKMPKSVATYLKNLKAFLVDTFKTLETYICEEDSDTSFEY